MFRETWRIESRNLLKRVRNFLPRFLHFFVGFESNSAIMLWSICDFRGYHYVSYGLKWNCIYACNLKVLHFVGKERHDKISVLSQITPF